MLSVVELSNGDTAEHTEMIRVGQMKHRFSRTQADLLTLAGKPPTSGTDDSVRSKVVVIPDAMARRGPMEVLGDLIEREKAR